jgi:hypothetical protein
MLLERIVCCRREWPLLPGHHVILSCLLWIRTEQHPVHYGRGYEETTVATDGHGWWAGPKHAIFGPVQMRHGP